MAKNFRELTKGFSPERKARIARIEANLEEEMTLAELRKAHKMSQETIAELLNIKQGNISEMERRTDVYVSTLRRYVKAMGGRLEVRAVFGDTAVRIKKFSGLEAVKITRTAPPASASAQKPKAKRKAKTAS